MEGEVSSEEGPQSSVCQKSGRARFLVVSNDLLEFSREVRVKERWRKHVGDEELQVQQSDRPR